LLAALFFFEKLRIAGYFRTLARGFRVFWRRLPCPKRRGQSLAGALRQILSQMAADVIVRKAPSPIILKKVVDNEISL
jgi:hypothetical protein